ncbi:MULTISPECIES: flagellar basal body P-ring protein FlgI [Sulfitobacter]|mgnify:FL=1|uniref:Flagellar P-ring protein n=1 Tax=Sulfitobacter faviae TaxID=1775881 RepID=A0AAX3LQT5_9RHOB|nr:MULTISPECIES: flagellar basal body P-ring protein FlgI [Sulfitobacter]NKX41557.1 flagellar basal body P-ring protein FlgI [Rhodobacteraceae bacterium R_SAG2]MBO9429934.1 flagellar basal body P-ring protein FlgI [Sulfitobacter sp. R18_1]MDF3350968.1 flagellar basal body P-ring protein FlgI [Sulfitobacter sp. KE12]MDF3354640.1 flagellar basal body P-ring protein FlgI [Sulfitobacter sp. KE27]MDF3358288.1 flagellar basal body P-ring protein FlgI [Sulfitobacter sp. KE33]
MNALFKLLLIGLTFALAAPAAAQVRIKDIVTVEGVRSNQLVGYGLVVGLNGTGDSLRNAPFTERAIEGMLERLGIGNLTEDQMRTANTAAVMVTASLPPFARAGSTIDVVVSSLGDASSLRGGTLIVTPLTAADGEIYAVAQGPIAVAGFAAQGLNASIVEGVPTGARIDNGAIVEREVDFDFSEMNSIKLALRNADFVTAQRVEAAINQAMGPVAKAIDSRTITVSAYGKGSLMETMALIEPLQVQPDQVAKVVIDARSGTIVIGANVRIDRVAVSQGGLTVTVRDDFNVSQPESLSIGGTTVVVPNSSVGVEEKDAKFAVIDGSVSLQRLVDGLNAIGVGATETISILQAIKAAGALHADLEII